MNENVMRLVDVMKVKGGSMPITGFIKKYGGEKLIKHVGRVPGLNDTHLQKMSVGIYFLCQGKEVVYVGQTENVRARIKSHKEDKGKAFDSVRFIDQVPVDLLDMLEAYYINKCRPIYNINYPISERL